MSFYKKVFTYFIAITLLVVAWKILPILEIEISSKPKPVTPRGELSSIEKTNIEIFNSSKDSVVYISTLQTVIDYWSLSVLNIPKGTGSGFVWDKFGHIVTNFHVIEDASEAIVTLSNNLKYKAKLVGADPEHDLAVLKIEPLPGVLKPVMIGDSSNLKVGQIVYAIGNPFGLDWTMTTGIISALDRVIDEGNGVKIKHAIQTDAAINPGNSGGPLLDSAGRVIGVNTAIYSPSGASAGIGFAIPINLVNKVVSSLIAYGHYAKPDIGIVSDDRINEILHKKFHIDGIVVLDVKAGSIAANLGIKPTIIFPDGTVIFGDIIQSVDGKKVSSFKEFEKILQEKGFGGIVRIVILRGNKKISFKIKL